MRRPLSAREFPSRGMAEHISEGGSVIRSPPHTARSRASRPSTARKSQEEENTKMPLVPVGNLPYVFEKRGTQHAVSHLGHIVPPTTHASWFGNAGLKRPASVCFTLAFLTIGKIRVSFFLTRVGSCQQNNGLMHPPVLKTSTQAQGTYITESRRPGRYKRSVTDWCGSNPLNRRPSHDCIHTRHLNNAVILALGSSILLQTRLPLAPPLRPPGTFVKLGHRPQSPTAAQRKMSC